MDKFDDYLEKKSKSEDKDFVLPKSFEDKLEETLNNLESKSKSNKYKYSKIIATAAGLVVVCLLGYSYASNNRLNNNLRLKTADNGMVTSEEARYDSGATEKYSEGLPNNELNDYGYATGESAIEEKIINENNINKIIFKNLLENSRYKAVNNQLDITKIVDIININAVNEISEVKIEEWQFLIETNGVENHIIMVSNNVMNIDDKWYEINSGLVNDINNLYSTLEYEEIYINSCDF